MLSDAGEAESVKFDAAVTVSVTVVLCWIPPPLPVTVMGYVPVGVLEPTVMLIVEVPAPGAGIVLGLKLTVVPDGAPEADRAIALLNPPLIVVVIVEVPWFPCWMLSEAGEADTEKLGCCCAEVMRICAMLGAFPDAILTVSVVPVSVTSCSWLLDGHWAAVQLLFAASMKCPGPGLLGLTVKSWVPLAPSLKMKLEHFPTPHWVPVALPVANPML